MVSPCFLLLPPPSFPHPSSRAKSILIPRARTFSGKTERPDGLKEVEKDRFRILHVPKKCTIKQFVLSNNLVFKCGRGFYEFTKPEIVSHKKEVRDDV